MWVLILDRRWPLGGLILWFNSAHFSDVPPDQGGSPVAPFLPPGKHIPLPPRDWVQAIHCKVKSVIHLTLSLLWPVALRRYQLHEAFTATMDSL